MWNSSCVLAFGFLQSGFEAVESLVVGLSGFVIRVGPLTGARLGSYTEASRNSLGNTDIASASVLRYGKGGAYGTLTVWVWIPLCRLYMSVAVGRGTLEYRTGPNFDQMLSASFDGRFDARTHAVENDDLAQPAHLETDSVNRHARQNLEELVLDVERGQRFVR